MRKYIKNLIFVSIVLMTTGISRSEGLPYAHYIGIDPIGQPSFGTPFSVRIQQYMVLIADSQTISIRISNGLQLISGSLNWKFTDTLSSPFNQVIQLEFTRMGIHHIQAKYDAVNLQITPTLFEKNLPSASHLWFYVREDTVVWRWTRWEIEDGIRDSLFYPDDVINRRNLRKQFALERQHLIASNTPPEIATVTSAKIGYFYTLNSSASINKQNLENYFTPYQVKNIRRYFLLFSQPQLERVDYFMEKDWLTGVTDAVRTQLSNLLKQQISDIYSLDQQILQTSDSTQCFQMLMDRSILLGEQIQARRMLIENTKR